jgi:phosphoribosyl 1,2-cyclic phosphate phosphodiesterase
MSTITFLGTGTSQGIPVIGCKCKVCLSKDNKDNRLRSSVVIEHNGSILLIDAGPDFRQQMLREGISCVDAVLLTHEHKDHTGGLDDVRAINFIRKEPFAIYCEERVMESLRREYSYVFEEYKYPGAPEFDIRIIDPTPFRINTVQVIPIRAFHYKLPILGFRIGDIAYITDANSIPDEEFDKLQNLSILVLNTVRREKHISHFSLDEAVEIAKKVKPKQCYLTHMSHQIGIHSDLDASLPDWISPAYDRLSITV